ncbi:MAG TPA: cyclic nucleotide-binding domain-containing protein, partial [Syntrophorhabdaceae bacterium]|nr:cyclic nucleotide-binding domain-containing protein [Syntrophorhabdaceae bacterium]
MVENETKKFVALNDVDSVVHILAEIAIFGGITEDQFDKISKRLQISIFEKGQDIFRKGDEPSHIYIVREGKVGLFIIDKQVRFEKKTLITGECFGVASLMAMRRHTSTAIALERSSVMVLSRESLWQLRHEDIGLFSLLMMNIARELARRLKLTDDILLNYMQTHKDG